MFKVSINFLKRKVEVSKECRLVSISWSLTCAWLSRLSPLMFPDIILNFVSWWGCGESPHPSYPVFLEFVSVFSVFWSVVQSKICFCLFGVLFNFLYGFFCGVFFFVGLKFASHTTWEGV